MSPATWFRLIGLCGLLVVPGALVPGWSDQVKGKRYALLVGVTEYDSKNFSSLRFPGNDADEMERTLKKAGFASVRVLTSKRGAKDAKDAPTAANVRAALKELLSKKTRHDTVLVGLAGHGVQLEVPDPQGKEESKQFSYFCPSDASFQDISYRTGRNDQLLLLDDLFEALGKSDAGHRLALIDACRNNSKVKAARRRIDVSRATIPDGVGVLFSCGRGQFAFETPQLGEGHGVFFYHVIQGLRGEAKNKGGVVTWDGLAGYVKGEVAKFVEAKIGDGARQTPASMGNLEGESVLARIAEEVKDRDGGTTVVVKDRGKEDKEPLEKVPLLDKDGKNSIGMKFVRIPAGTFTMGSDRDDAAAQDDEKPAHTVKIAKSFYLGVYEVTQRQWKEVMGNNPSWFSRDGDGAAKVKNVKDEELDHFPVENVSYKDVEAFVKKLNGLKKEKEAGRQYRLPTEAEWEYACRGGASSATPYSFGKSITDELANYDKNLGRTCKVGSYKPNAWGLYDMHGNVREWCADWYDKDWYKNRRDGDPSGPRNGSAGVFRGGGWNESANSCRSASRTSLLERDRPRANLRANWLGLRLVVVSTRER